MLLNAVSDCFQPTMSQHIWTVNSSYHIFCMFRYNLLQSGEMKQGQNCQYDLDLPRLCTVHNKSNENNTVKESEAECRRRHADLRLLDSMTGLCAGRNTAVTYRIMNDLAEE